MCASVLVCDYEHHACWWYFGELILTFILGYLSIFGVQVPRRASHLSPPKKPSPHSKVRDHGFKTYYESQEIRTEKLADLTGKQLLFESKMAAQKLALAKLNSGISNLVDDNNKTYRVMNGRVDDIFLK